METYKKLNIVRDSMRGIRSACSPFPPCCHIYSIVTPNLSFPWWLIPRDHAISWISHLAAYGSAKRRLEKKLFQQANAPGGWKDLFNFGKSRRAAARVSGPYAALYAEAEASKEAIAAQVRAAGKDSPFDQELVPSLEEYVGQIRLLTQTVSEIDSIIDSIPMKDLEKDKAELNGKLAGPASEALRAEYAQSVREIEKQEKSFQDLKDQGKSCTSG
jgi:hypothetical protein